MRSLLLSSALLTLVACASSPSAEEPAQPAKAADTAAPADTAAHAGPKHAKVYAPVALELTTSGRVGEVDLHLTITADADVPASEARLVLPEGVRLVSGALKTPIGALAKGQTADVKARIAVPAQGAFSVAAGVQMQMGPGRQLSRSTVIKVGAVAPTTKPGRVIELPEGGGVRVGR